MCRRIADQDRAGVAGAALIAPGVDRIAFTGESGTGRTIARAASANLVPVTDEEGIAMASSARYGLNAMVFSESLSGAHWVPAVLRAGAVWVNCFFIRDLRHVRRPGDSGIGREGGTSAGSSSPSAGPC